MQFEFATAKRILFGEGSLNQAGKLAAEIGRRALMVHGRSRQRAERSLNILQEARVEGIPFSVAGEPVVAVIQAGVQAALEQSCDLVIAIGGGSAIDAGKAIAILATNRGKIFDYLEVVGKGKPLTKPGLPLIAIPTTAGTGAEVTRNAVIGAPEHKVKVSLRSPYMLARLALVDPELTYSLPPEVTASSGMDALTQLIEPFLSNKANPMTDALCREGMKRAARALLKAYQDGSDAAARRDMSIASLFSGMALANAKLGAVHGFAGSFGGMFSAPHGAVCARLLPEVMEVNLEAIRERQRESQSYERFIEVAQILTGDLQASPEEGVAWVKQLYTQLNIPPLSTYGLCRADFPELIEKASVSSSMQGNPVKLTADEMERILEQAII